MSEVRALAAGDIDAVTALYLRILRRDKNAPSRALTDYVRSFYFDGPYRDPEIPALVHVSDTGKITGFVGVHTVPYLIGEAKARAAFCGALMSEDHESDPLAGARLLKAFFSGPQDISVSETANVVSEAMWTRLRGQTIPAYSFEWFRILRPAGFVAALAAEKVAPLRRLAGLAHIIDGRPGGSASLIRFNPAPIPAGLSVIDIDSVGFAEGFMRFSATKTARPNWNDGYLDHVLSTAMDKPLFGKPMMAEIRTRSGEVIGAFLYHLNSGGIGRVLQIFAMPGRFGVVLDLLLAHAYEHGAVGLRGRSSPDLLAAAPGRSMIMATVSSTVIHAKDASSAEPFLAGDCVLTGLAGERWNRFFGGDFSA